MFHIVLLYYAIVWDKFSLQNSLREHVLFTYKEIMLYVQISIVILCLTSYQILYSSVWNIYVQETHEIILAWTVYTQVISTKIFLFIMHSCILLNLHVTPPFLSKVGYSDCRNILWCSKESQHGGASLWYLEQVLDVLSFYINKTEVMYRFK